MNFIWYFYPGEYFSVENIVATVSGVKELWIKVYFLLNVNSLKHQRQHDHNSMYSDKLTSGLQL